MTVSVVGELSRGCDNFPTAIKLLLLSYKPTVVI
jgi:hypothetical protein